MIRLLLLSMLSLPVSFWWNLGAGAKSTPIPPPSGSALLLEDNSSRLLMEDNSSKILLES